MSGTLPQWAIVRVEEARTMADGEDRGPWVGQHMCARGTPGVLGAKDTEHPAEEPYFFHCKRCIAGMQSNQPPLKPNDKRDQGLCDTCSGPSEPRRDKIITNNAAAMQAEEFGTTIARLTTLRFCAACDPAIPPFCSARMCPKNGKRHRATCSNPSHSSVPHCAAQCERRKKQWYEAGKRRKRVSDRI